jgi:hypothetical protein
VLQDYFAYEPTFRGGVTVAAGDVNGDGVAEVITGTGVGGGPRVEVFDQNADAVQNFYAFPDSFRSGVPVVAADLNGDGKAEIVALTGPGEAGDPAEVATFAAATDGGEAVDHVVSTGADFNGGVAVAVTDQDGDGKQEIVVMTRSGDGVRIQIFAGLNGSLAGDFERSFDMAPTIQASGFTTTEGDAGAHVAKFTVTLSGPYDKPVTVDYSTIDGTAKAETDYVATHGTLTFNPGDTSLVVPVMIVGDRTADGDKTMFLQLSNPTNGYLGTAAAEGDITNDGSIQGA